MRGVCFSFGKIAASFLMFVVCILFPGHALCQCSTTTAPSYSSGCTDEYFTSISASGTGVISTINVTAGSCTGVTYFNDYATQGIIAPAGSTVSLNISRVYTTYTGYLTAYVDWNNDGIYETTELAGSTFVFGSHVTSDVYNFTIPVTGVVFGTNLHMRVFLSEQSTGAPCSANYGGAYDFYLNVICGTPPVISVSPSSGSLCLGGPGVSLTASGAGSGGTYVWSPSAGLSATTGASVIAAPTGTTIYTVTGTTSAGCSNVANVTVTVNPLPSRTISSSGSLSFCTGDSVTLTSTAGAEYQWYNGLLAISGATNGSYTATTTGTYALFITNGFGCFDTSALVNVTVYPTPPPISGILNVCVGLVTALSDAGGGTWSASNGNATVGLTSGIVTGITPTLDTITYFLSTGCLTTAVVTVDPLPTAILGTLSVCSGSTTTLSDAGGGTWSSSSTTIASVGSTTGIVIGGTVTATSIATITYTIGTGCSTTAVVTVNPLPTSILGDMNVCNGFTTTLSDATGSGTWSSSNIVTATVGSTTGIVNGNSVGTATISYILNSTGCYVTSVVTVNTQPLNINGNTGPICETFTLSLSDVTSGGVWSSVTTTVGTVGSTSGIVTGIGVGTTIVSYTLGSCAVTAIVTVNLQPTPILGMLSVCESFTTSLSDATGGGAWSSVSGVIGTIGTTGIVTGITVGTTVISYTIGSCAATAIVTVNETPVAITGTTSVCQTFTTTLTDATGGGLWTSLTTTVGTVSSTSGVVTGIGVGTTVISYSIGSCYATTVVTVNTQPTAILGTLSVCEGFTTSLSDATGTGTWSSVSGSIGSVSTTGVVTGITVGTAIISYTIGNCAATAVVTVNPTPVAITGNTGAICQTFSIPLSDVTGGGLWTSATTTIGTVGSTTGIVTGIGVGTTVISYSIGSCAATAIVTVDQQPAAISGILSVCQGLTTSLSDATGSGAWSSVSGTIGTISATGIVTGIATGTTVISYTLGICAAEATVTVQPLPTAITGTMTVCSGSTTNLGDTPGGGTWSSSNITVATVGLTTGVVTGQTVAVATTVTITYTAPSTCYMTTIVTVNPLPTAILGPNNVCLGSTVTLSDAGGGTWSSANTLIATVGSSTGVVTGISVNVTTITYKLATGCYITAPMTVNPLPVAIAGPTVVCPFASITLTDATGGGNWTSSNTAIATVGLTTGIVTGVAAGGVDITYTLGTGCYVTYAITVNPAPVPLITPVGDTTFCPGGFVALTANTGAGLSYQWYVGGATITGALSSSYIATLTGSYQVFETNSFGCSTLSIPMQVTVETPTAAITTSGSTTICAGYSITLDANIGVGLSYQWLLDGVAITGATGSTLTTSTAGNYAAVVTNATGCSATSNVITVSTISSPTANVTLSGPLTFCQGGSVTFTTDFALGYTYQWYNGSGAISAASSQSYTATATDNYYVIVTNTNGCTATSIVISVVANPLPDVSITASGPTLFCSGGSVTLSATAVGGDTYQWYLGGAAIAGATNSSYLATAGGGYQVQVVDPATGCSAMTLADTNVTVVTTPVIVPVTPASFCWGGSALLSTSLSGASGTVTYQWYFNGAAIAGATGPTYNATAPGNYSCQINIPGSCTVTTLAIPVVEFPLPNPIVTFDGTYLQTGTYYVTYQWYNGLTPIAGATTSSTPCTGPANYKVDVTDTNGCQSYSDVYVDTSCSINTGGGSTAVPNVTSGEIKIYPNPAQTMVHIEAAMQVRVMINSIDGRTLLNIDHAKDVNISNLADGIYMIMLYDSNGNMVKVEKLVKS